MASIVKVVGTIDVQSDILGKEAGTLVKSIIEEIIPVLKKAVADFIKEEPKKETK